MDFITKLPKLVRGYDPIFFIVEKLTKVSHLIPIKETFPNMTVDCAAFRKPLNLPSVLFLSLSSHLLSLSLASSLSIPNRGNAALRREESEPRTELVGGKGRLSIRLSGASKVDVCTYSYAAVRFFQPGRAYLQPRRTAR